MWSFNQNQPANDQNSNLGWNVNNAYAGGGENRELCSMFGTYGKLLLLLLSIMKKR